MKSLEIKLFFLLLFPLISLEAKVILSYCFKQPIKVECIDLKNGNSDFSGEFILKGTKYAFGARRAMHTSDRCLPALKKINEIMSAKKYRIEFEGDYDGDTLLLIEGFFSSRGKWIYFEGRKQRTPSYLTGQYKEISCGKNTK